MLKLKEGVVGIRFHYNKRETQKRETWLLMAPQSFKTIYVSFQCSYPASQWGRKKYCWTCNSVVSVVQTSPSSERAKNTDVLNVFIKNKMKMNLHDKKSLLISTLMKCWCTVLSVYIQILSSSLRKIVNSVLFAVIQTTWLRQTILTFHLQQT